MIYSFTHNFTVRARNLLSQRPGINDEMRTHYQSSPCIQTKKEEGTGARCICAQRKSINPFYHQSKLACTESIGLTQLCSLCVRPHAIPTLYRDAGCRYYDKRDSRRDSRVFSPRIYAPRRGFSVLLITACNSE